MRQYEYEWLCGLDPNKAIDRLNDMGLLGWELVAIGHSATDAEIFYLKRLIDWDKMEVVT